MQSTRKWRIIFIMLNCMLLRLSRASYIKHRLSYCWVDSDISDKHREGLKLVHVWNNATQLTEKPLQQNEIMHLTLTMWYSAQLSIQLTNTKLKKI